MPSYKPEGSEPICAGRAFQDGKGTPSTRIATTRELDDKNGSKGCIPSNLHTSKSPVPPPVCLGGEVLQVLKSPLLPLLGTTSAYQNFETGDSLAETDRPTAYSVPGRHVIYTCQQGSTRDIGSTAMQVIRISGIDGKHTEVPINPSSKK